ncbi:MAG: phosphatidylglycerol lysyltransferase domain-containing protein [Thermoguttaceae bacterium]
MIPSFPQFKPLQPSDQAGIESFSKRFPPYSDFNFANMWSWDTESRVHICRLAEHLVVEGTDDATGEPFYSFLGTGGSQSLRVAETLLARACAEGRQPRLKLVPHEVMALLHGTHLLFWEDRASDDYIIDVENLLLYVGTRFVHARRNVNKFMRSCPDVRVVQLDLGSKGVREEIDQLRTTWTYNKGMSLPNEKTAMERLLAVSTALHLIGTGVYQQGRLIAFSIVEVLERGYAMGHFAKCDAEFSGLSHYLYQATARAASNRGCRYLNVQEDLGIAGLRTFKMLLRPISFLKKYAVTCQTACLHKPAPGCLHNGHRTASLLPVPQPSWANAPRAGLYASG